MKPVLDTNVPISSVIATGVPHDDVVKYFSKLQAVSPPFFKEPPKAASR